GSTLQFAGVLSNHGTFNFGFGDSSFGAPITLTAAGLSNTGSLNVAGGSAANTATVTVNGDAGNAGTVNVANFGAIALAAGHAYTQNARSTVVSGTLNAATVDVEGGFFGAYGSVNAPVVTVAGGKLFGIGTIVGDVTDTGGTVFGGTVNLTSPFGPVISGPGTLTVNGSFTETGGVLEAVLTSGQTGQLNVTGANLNLLGGTLQADT